MTAKFYTTGNPFNHPAFAEWAANADLKRNKVVEPFAGANDLVERLHEAGYWPKVASYDIEPGAIGITQRDTIKNFPEGYSICITNPPWLAKNAAAKRGIDTSSWGSQWTDLYQAALVRCIWNCRYVAALVPESFIRSGKFWHRLQAFVSVLEPMFEDTVHPVGLALFGPESTDPVIWSGHRKVGRLSALRKYLPQPEKLGDRWKMVKTKFNDPNGNLGLRAIDGKKGPGIKFCKPEELGDYIVRPTCRSLTKITTPKPVDIEKLNKHLVCFREQTQDVFLTAYRELRNDGKYRRRLDWFLASKMIAMWG